MAITAAILGGLGALAATGSAIGASMANKKYQNYLDAEAHRDPLSTLGNASLLKLREKQREEGLEEINNRAVAGGATFENQLAARKNLNRADSEFQSRLLLNEDARRQAYESQIAQAKLQDAKNWTNWGSAMSNALIGVGSTYLLEGAKDPIGDLIKNWGKKPKTTFGKINPLQAISADNSLGSVTR